MQTILPDRKIRAVVFGSRMRMMAAANRFGLYSTFFPFRPMSHKSRFVPSFAVETIFYSFGFPMSEKGIPPVEFPDG